MDDKQHTFEPVDQLLARTARSVLINTPLQADSGTRTRDPTFDSYGRYARIYILGGVRQDCCRKPVGRESSRCAQRSVERSRAAKLALYYRDEQGLTIHCRDALRPMQRRRHPQVAARPDRGGAAGVAPDVRQARVEHRPVP